MKRVLFLLAIVFFIPIYLSGCDTTESGTENLESPEIFITQLEHVYDGTKKEVMVELSTADDSFEVEYKLNGTKVTEPISAGEYDVTVKVSGDGLKTVEKSEKMIINPKELTLVDVVAEEKVYDGNTTVKFLSNGTLEGVVTGDTVQVVKINANTSLKDVGEHEVIFKNFVLGGKDKNNYVIKAPTDVVAKITPKQLKLDGIIIDSKEENSGLSASYTGTPILVGVVGSDEVQINIERFEFLDELSGLEKNMKLYSTLTGKDALNYYIDADDCGVFGTIGIYSGDFLLEAITENDVIVAYNVMSYLGNEAEVTIPSEYNNLPVIGLAKNIFANNNSIVTINIPSSIQVIDQEAFYKSNVQKVNFASNSQLRTIGYMAFAESAIESIVIPKNTSLIRGDAFKDSSLKTLSFEERNAVDPLRLNIEERVFFNTQLVDVVIPGYVSAMGFGCFQEIKTLNSVIFEKSLYDINFGNAPDGRAWTFAWSSLKSLTLNGGITTIPKTFAQETPLKTLVLSEGIRTIGFCAFIFTTVEAVTIPSTVTRIEEGAFKSIQQLRTVKFTSGGTQPLIIEPFVFYQTSIESIVIPDRVSYLGWGTIAEIQTLRSVIIEQGSGAIKLLIANDAFNECSNLTSIELPDRVEAYAENVFDSWCTVINGEGKSKKTEDLIFNIP